MDKKPPNGRDANMQKSINDKFAYNQLGPSGKPRAHNPHYRSKKAAREAAKMKAKLHAFKGKNKAIGHGPHAHLPKRHFHTPDKNGRPLETSNRDLKVHHTYGRNRTAAKAQGKLQRGGYRYQSKFKQRQAQQQQQQQQQQQSVARHPSPQQSPNRGRTR